MKKIALFVMMICLAISSVEGFSQEKAKSKRQIRKEERLAEINEGKAHILDLIQKRNFVFIARELYNPNIKKLNDMSSVRISSKRFVCNLPAGGSLGAIASVESASMQDYLDIDVEEYKLKVKDAGKRGYNVTIEVTNQWNKLDYIFRFNVTPDGLFTTLDVSTKLSSSIRYSGEFIENPGTTAEALERKAERLAEKEAAEAEAKANGTDENKSLIDLF